MKCGQGSWLLIQLVKWAVNELIMPGRANSLLEYQQSAAQYLREFELKRAHGNAEKTREISEMSDIDLLKKWMWIVSIVGFPICYLLVPIILMGLQLFIWVWIMQFLWLIAKGAMGIVFIIFMLAIYFTTRKDPFQE